MSDFEVEASVAGLPEGGPWMRPDQWPTTAELAESKGFPTVEQADELICGDIVRLPDLEDDLAIVTEFRFREREGYVAVTVVRSSPQGEVWSSGLLRPHEAVTVTGFFPIAGGAHIRECGPTSTWGW